MGPIIFIPSCSATEAPDAGGLPRARLRSAAYTLIEVLIVTAVIGAMAAIAMPAVHEVRNLVKVRAAAEEVRVLQNEIAAFEATHGRLPVSLGEVERSDMVDPWGNPYEYLNLEAGRGGGGGGEVMGEARKDRFLVPLNSDYDLYSKGADGKSRPPLTAEESWDDVVRASDGGYIGLASEY